MSAAADSPACWQGRLHDGLTAAAHPVEARLGPTGLEISGPDGVVLAAWPYAALEALEPVRNGEPARLAPGGDGDARLTLAEPRVFGALVERAPQIAGRPLAQALRAAGYAALWIGAVGLLAAALWFGWPKLADAIAAAMPARIEARIGAHAHAKLLANARACDAAGAQAALHHLLALLTAAMPYDKPVTVTVVDLPVVNAFALPGDEIVLFQRLIAEAQSPEELAAVLAHELGHLAGHHPMRNLVRQFGLELIIVALSGSSSWDGAAQLLLASAYTREFETEADTRALDTLARASIGGAGWVAFFDRHAGSGGRWDRATAYLSTHPPSAERRDRAARLPPSGVPIMSAGDWLVLKSICRRDDRDQTGRR